MACRNLSVGTGRNYLWVPLFGLGFFFFPPSVLAAGTLGNSNRYGLARAGVQLYPVLGSAPCFPTWRACLEACLFPATPLRAVWDYSYP